MLKLYEVNLICCNPYCVPGTSNFEESRFLDLNCSKIEVGNLMLPAHITSPPTVGVSINHDLSMHIAAPGRVMTYQAHPLELAEAFGSTDEYLANGRIMIYDGKKSVIWRDNNFSKLI